MGCLITQLHEKGLCRRPDEPADLADLSYDDIALVLGPLHARYPAFRFRCAQVGWLGPRWVGERINGLDPGLHTMITADLAELREALAQDEARHAG